jgi:hypothetical protein
VLGHHVSSHTSFFIIYLDNTFWASNTNTIMANSQQAQPFDDASTHDGFDGEDKASVAAGFTTKDSTSEQAVEYPPPAQGALVMLALLLALFLSALVSQQSFAISTSLPID